MNDDLAAARARIATEEIRAQAMKKRLTILFLMCFFLAGAVIFRSIFIQGIGDARLERLARRQFQAKMLVQPKRGQILDRSGLPLAVNVESRSLAVNPAKLQKQANRRVVLRRLGALLGDLPVEEGLLFKNDV